MALVIAGAVWMAGSAPAGAAELLFKGTDVSIPSSFACEGKTFVAGKYDLSAFYEPQPNEGTHLQVFKGTRMICEVKGSSTTANSDLAASKVRMLTRLNSQMQCVQIDIVLPSSVRERIHNQVFYLPQPARK